MKIIISEVYSILGSCCVDATYFVNDEIVFFETIFI